MSEATGNNVKAQIPGTFYRKPGPESEPYVSEGGKVSAGDVVGLIEVMKSFHEVKAEQDGTVARFLIEDGDAVAPGQDLLELE